MSITTFSRFFQPLVVDINNRNLNFTEGAGPELTAVLEIGSVTHSEMAVVLKTALDAAGALTYTVTFNRSDRTFTIATTSAFGLLITSGSQIGTGPFTLIGFTGADLTGLTTYTGDSGSGLEYLPQFLLQDYIAPGENKEKVEASINESASGKIEVISYGTRQFISFSLKFITSRTDVADGHIIKFNATGKEDAITFFTNIITKNKFEFMPDKDTQATFFKILLESAPGSSTGTGFKLKELTGDGIPNVYEIDNVKCRVVE